MSTSCAIEEAGPENVRAMLEFTKEYGVYKKVRNRRPARSIKRITVV